MDPPTTMTLGLSSPLPPSLPAPFWKSSSGPQFHLLMKSLYPQETDLWLQDTQQEQRRNLDSENSKIARFTYASSLAQKQCMCWGRRGSRNHNDESYPHFVFKK